MLPRGSNTSRLKRQKISNQNDESDTVPQHINLQYQIATAVQQVHSGVTPNDPSHLVRVCGVRLYSLGNNKGQTIKDMASFFEPHRFYGPSDEEAWAAEV